MRRSTHLLFTGMMLTALAGCTPRTDRPVASTTDGKTSVSPSGDSAAAAGKSMVRLVNAIPAGSSISILADKHLLFSDVGYKTVTPYLEVEDNRVEFTLHHGSADTALAHNSEAMRDGARYTIVALSDPPGVGLRILTDDLATDSTKARIRVINASKTAKDVDVALQGQKDPLFHSVGYGSEANYVAITPVTATVEIRRNDPRAAPVLVKNMRFDAGKSYSLVLTSAKPGTLEAITVQDTETPSALSKR